MLRPRLVWSWPANRRMLAPPDFSFAWRRRDLGSGEPAPHLAKTTDSSALESHRFGADLEVGDQWTLNPLDHLRLTRLDRFTQRSQEGGRWARYWLVSLLFSIT